MHRLITGPFPALAPWLCADIPAWLGAPHAPRRIVLLSGAGLAGRRLEDGLLRAGVPPSRLRRHTLAAFAEALLPRGSGIPLPLDGDDALLRQVAGSLPADDLLTAALHRPGVRRAVRRVAAELAAAGFATEAEMIAPLVAAAGSEDCANPALLRALARMVWAYRAALAARGYTDDAARLTAACAAIERGMPLPGPVYLHGMLELSGLEERFIRAVAARVPLTALLPHDGTPASRWLDAPRAFFLSLGCTETALADRGVPPLLAAVRAAWAADEPAAATARHATTIPSAPLEVIAAPGAAREMREAARQAVRAARAGVPPAAIAILFRDGNTYRRLAHETLVAAGIPHYLPGGLPLNETRAGRALACLLSLAGPERRRAEVLELLLTAPLRWETLLGAGAAPTPEAWDRLSRLAGITGGAEQWRERLAALGAELAQALQQAGEQEETAEAEHPHTAALRQELGRLAALSRVVERLFARLDALRRPRPWRQAVAHLSGLVTNLLDDPSLATVLTMVDGLSALDGLEPDGRPEALHAAVTRALAATAIPIGAFDRDVFVGDLTNVRGLSFHTVILLGVAERAFPAPPPRDPLLDDGARRAINAAVAGLPGAPWLPEQRPGYEELLFQQVLSAARARLVLLYPFQDADGRERQPSYLLLRVAEALAGRPVEAMQLPSLSIYRRISPARLAPDEPVDAISALEYDLAEVERALAAGPVSTRLGYLDDLSPDFRHARAATAARASHRFGAHGGVFTGDEARRRVAEAYGLGGRALAVTDIETYARCPRRYFLSRVLRLDRLDEPAEVRRIRPDTRGTLIHAILQRFYEETHDAGELPLCPEREEHHRARLLGVAADRFAEEEQRGRTGTPLVWQVERSAIEEDLIEWLAQEIADTANGLTPVRFETGFGTGPGAQRPVTVEVDGVRLRFRARLDRIDATADGCAFRVVDYKTGRAGGERDGQLRGGTAMQLPVYLLGARSLFPGAEGSAEYHYVTRAGTFRRVRFDVATLQQREREIAQVLRTVTAGVAAGRFFPAPGEKKRNCARCPFADLCDQRIDVIGARREQDPDAAALLALRAIP